MGELVAGRYRLERAVGHGAMAVVYEAEDTELGRRVAVKILAPGADADRFDREARTSAALDHAGIVRVFDVGDDERGPFLVFELVPGGTLDDRLETGTALEDAETVRIATQVAAALAHAHERGVVHRDIKPANVLFDDAGNVKLADFGIAAARGSTAVTESGTVLGTALYMAPEQAEAGAATPATDVYAFGVLLYRMLTGRLPFEGDNAIAVARRHVEEEPASVTTLRPDAPQHLAALAAGALAKNPAARPRDGAALLAALGTAAPAAPLEDATAERAAAVAPPRRRVLLAGTVLAAVVLAAGFGLAAVLGDGPAPAKAPTSTDGERTQIGRTPTSVASLTTGRGTVPTRATSRRGTTTAQAATHTSPTADTVTTEPVTTEPGTVAETTVPTNSEATTTDATTTEPATTEPTTTAPPEG